MMTDRMYAEVYRRYAGFVKRFAANDVYEYGDAFSAVRLVAATASEDFLAELDATALRYVDYVSAHFYCDTRPSAPDDVEGGYRRLVVEGIGNLERSLAQASSAAERFSTEVHPIRVALDEWGTWYWDHATPHNGLTQPVTMQDALFGAGCFHALFRSPRVGLANLAQAVNVLSSLIRTDGLGFCLTPMYHLFRLMSPHRGATGLTVAVSGSPAVDFGGTAERNAFDAAATLNTQGDEIYVTAVNYHPSLSVVLELSVAGDERWNVVRALRLRADGVREGNTPREPERVKPEVLTLPRGEELTLPPATILAVALQKAR
jgi:alpha-N-arabinofuranosidase